MQIQNLRNPLWLPWAAYLSNPQGWYTLEDPTKGKKHKKKKKKKKNMK